MWLINTNTLQLEEFVNHPKNEYAILSHRWEDNEANFKSWGADKNMDTQGCRKVMKFVQKAAERGFKYAWADTCCINKESSAELSEAINSMFKYYQDAAECYVYLSDLPSLQEATISGLKLLEHDNETADQLRNNAFIESKWFTRGWTLQELIAPSTALFFDSDWRIFGTKSDLKAMIEQVTRIPQSMLDGSEHLPDFSIACRMSWASSRQTTRSEDIAYCLLGICDIYMPLLYGEGQAAFTRLQEEICKKTTDMSLFAWKTLQPDECYSGLLARSPENFQESGKIFTRSSAIHTQTDFNDEIAVANRGIRFDNMSLYLSRQYDVLLKLNCWDWGSYQDLYIYLRQVRGIWVRCRANEIAYLDDEDCAGLKSLPPTRIFILRTAGPESLQPSDLFGRTIGFEFSSSITLISAEPSNLWDFCIQGFQPTGAFHGVVHISTKLEHRGSEEFLVLCGVKYYDIFNWKAGYWFTVLGQKDEYFMEIRDLVRNKRLHTHEGYNEMNHYSGVYQRGCCWKESCFLDDSAIGLGYQVSVRAEAISEKGAGEDSWEVIKLHVMSQTLRD